MLYLFYYTECPISTTNFTAVRHCRVTLYNSHPANWPIRLLEINMRYDNQNCHPVNWPIRLLEINMRYNNIKCKQSMKRCTSQILTTILEPHLNTLTECKTKSGIIIGWHFTFQYVILSPILPGHIYLAIMCIPVGVLQSSWNLKLRQSDYVSIAPYVGRTIANRRFKICADSFSFLIKMTRQTRDAITFTLYTIISTSKLSSIQWSRCTTDATLS